MKKTPYLTLLLTCAIILAGCIDDPNQNTQEAVPVIVADDSSLVYYLSTKPEDEFSISDGEITGDILKLTASFLGNCKEHNFLLIAAKGINKKIPPGGFMFLVHDAHEDMCTDEVSEVLLFDLSPYREYLQSHGLLESGTIGITIFGVGGILYGFSYSY